MFRTGQEIGQYTLVKRLGRGGFGEVWLAERRAKFVTTKVAVKLPLDELIDVESIRQEAVLWEQASGHPNVLPIIDADEYDGQIVIVSEYAPDGSLEDLLKREGALPVKKAVELTIGVLGGLEFLHSRKIIHRDIKPANILLQGETPRLADFGVSRIMKTTSVSVHLSGTPGYMAPESFDRKRTVQTDLWSVGVILYQMLKGILPFPYDNFTELLGAIVLKEPDPLPDSVPPVLRGIVFRALAKDPGERFQSAREMRAALADFLIGIAQSSLSQTVEMPLPVLSPTVEMPLPVLSPTVETTLPAEVETVVRSVAAPVAPTIESSAVGRAAEIEIPAPDEETDSPADDPKIPGYLKIAAILGLLAVVFGVVYLVGRDRIPAANTVATGAEGKDNAANATASKTVAANQNGVESSKQTEPATDQAGQNSAEFDSRMKAAQLYYEKGNYAKAIENLRAANRLNPDNYEVLVNLGNANFDAENYEEAAEWYMSALARKPDDTNVRTDLGLTYMMRRTPDYDRGIEELNKVLETNPDNPPALQNLTVAYTKKGDAARAGEMLARFEKVDPKNPAIPKLRAGIQKIAGK